MEKYVGEGTRASFVRNVFGVDIMTTKDQYKYGADTVSNKLAYMEDKNDNRVNLVYISGKLTKPVDTAKKNVSLYITVKTYCPR